MSTKLKGEAGEELFATFFVIALVFVFIFSVIGVYSNFMGGQAQLYAERAASGIAERIYFDSGGYLTVPACQALGQSYNAMNNTAVKITYREGGTEKNCAFGSLDTRSVSVASMPIIIISSGNMRAGRIDAMVGV